MHRLRRPSKISVALSALLIVSVLWLLPMAGSDDPQLASGWTLLLLALLLLVYRLRKALPFMRLAAVSSWRRVHIVLGLLLPLILLLHLGSVGGSAWPGAPLEWLLLLLLLLASMTGLLLGWRAQRMPSQLTVAGGNVLLDAIPRARALLQAEARQRLLEVAGGPMQRPYSEILAALLPGGRGRTAVLPSSRPQHFSIAQWRELSGLLKRALDLDSQRRRQRGWRVLLTIHAASSYALLIFVLLHLLQAYRILPQ